MSRFNISKIDFEKIVGRAKLKGVWVSDLLIIELLHKFNHIIDWIEYLYNRANKNLEFNELVVKDLKSIDVRLKKLENKVNES